MQSVLTTVTLLAALAACLGCAFAILREVPTVVLGASASVAVLTTLAPGFGGPFAIVREIARAVLPADLAGTRCLLPVLGEVAGIPRVSLVRHLEMLLLVSLTGSPVLYATGASGGRLSSRLP
jgi:hypothetical protein